MNVGCVTEVKNNEYRVGLTPDNAKEYLRAGHSVMVQAGAGEGSGFEDEAYRAAGATLAATAEEVWAASDLMVKVKEPTPAEYPLMRQGQILYAYLHLAADEPLTRAMLDAGVKGVAYETVTDSRGALPLLAPMSQIAGRLSVIEGAKYLEKPFGGSGVLMSGAPGAPGARVVVVGGGVVGTNACKMALGFGADVTIMDVSLPRLAELDDMFGGRAKTVYSTQSALERETAGADLIIGAVLIPGAAAPKLIKREMLKGMRPGSVLVDVAVDQGGCSETTRPTTYEDPTFVEEGVLHYCVANMPGAVSRTSTIALTNATLHYGLQIAALGLEAAAGKDPGLLAGINTYAGRCTFEGVARAFGLECVPAETLF